MSKKYLFFTIFVILCTFIQSCSAIPMAAKSPTPTVASTATAEPSATPDLKATEGAKKTATTIAQEANEKSTEEAEKKMAQIEESNKTQEAAPFYSTIEKLYDEKIISSKEGVYYRIGNFEKSWPQIDWYQWWDMNVTADNFVMESDVSYDTASMMSNWESTGCGFVFRSTDDPDVTGFHHYRVFVAMDGKVYLSGLDGYEYYENRQYGKFLSFGKAAWSAKRPSGEFKIRLIMDKDWMTVYINDKQLLHKQDKTFAVGNLAFTLASGTNKGTGTTCKFTNNQLWVIH